MEKIIDQVKVILKNRPDLLNDEFRSENRSHPLEGHCYVASEAIYYLIGGKESEYTPHYIRHNGVSHWFLKSDDGSIIDPTAEQFDTKVPYEEGIGKGFPSGSNPSKRTQEVIEEVENLMNDKIRGIQ